MNQTQAPIAFFAFNRPEHAARSLRALAANPDAAKSTLRIFIDGPRNADDLERVESVRNVARHTRGFADMEVHAAGANQGLFAAITSGVGHVLRTHDRVIVVEDDVEVSPCFLTYMNTALSRYRDEARVGSIHGYTPPIPGLPDYFFLAGGDCWGWATWNDRWPLFEPNPATLLRALAERRLLRAFIASHGAQSLLQLVRRAQGRSQSWATLWHASLFLAGRHTLHPGKSFVYNSGNDGTGSHAARSTAHDTLAIARFEGVLPSDVSQDTHAANALSRFLDRQALRNVPLLPDSVGRTLLSAWSMWLARRVARKAGPTG